MAKYTGNAPTLEQLKNELANEERGISARRTVRTTGLILIVAAAAAIIVAMIFMPVVQISGVSMTPTLQNQDLVLCIKLPEYKKGDIVGVYYGNEILVKRIIAGPGDWIDIDKDGNVFVNEELIDEPYVQEKDLGYCDTEFPMQIPDKRLFVMGDYRAESLDSRATQIGAVRIENVIGKLWLRVWPLKSIKQFVW